MNKTSKEAVENLIKRAEENRDGAEAMKFSQAACNAANALATLDFMERRDLGKMEKP